MDLAHLLAPPKGYRQFLTSYRHLPGTNRRERLVPHSEYFAAYRAAIARLHRRQWSWARLRFVCRCGSELPCPVRQAWEELPPEPEAGSEL
jgi:hypothetical protein